MRPVDKTWETEPDVTSLALRARVGICLIDATFHCTWTNETFTNRLRYGHDELIGQSLIDLIHPGDIAHFEERARRVLNGEIPFFATRNRYTGGDGSIVTCDLVTTTCTDSDGTIVSGMIIQTSASRTDAKTRRIETLQRSAAIGQLTASAVHDIRNSLSSMSLIGETLNNTFGPHEGVDVLRREIDASLALLGSISAFARPSASATPDDNGLAFSVGALVKQTIPLLKIVVPAGTTLTFDLAEEQDFPNIEPREFQQVLLNLVLNACDATVGSAGTIIIAATHSAHDSTCIDVSVSDNGVGMAPGELGQIFDPYFTTKGETGTGLGLSICREIVERHGGQLLASSTLGEGSTFIIRLPRT